MHTLHSYHGPGMFALGRTETVSTGTPQDITEREGDHVRLEFLSEESGPYCLDGKIEFIYSGKGSAALSMLAIERT